MHIKLSSYYHCVKFIGESAAPYLCNNLHRSMTVYIYNDDTTNYRKNHHQHGNKFVCNIHKVDQKNGGMHPCSDNIYGKNNNSEPHSSTVIKKIGKCLAFIKLCN